MIRALVLSVLCAAPAAADMVCRPDLRCDDRGCRADSGNEEAFFYVTDPAGRSQLYVSEGTWADARRTQADGLTVWTAPTPAGGTLRLALRPDTSTFLATLSGPDAAPRTAAGRCATR